MQKQAPTAVQWLVERLNQCEPWYSGLDDNLTKHINHLISAAKDLERQQIIDAYNSGQQIPPFEYAVKFYEQTYGK